MWFEGLVNYVSFLLVEIGYLGSGGLCFEFCFRFKHIFLISLLLGQFISSLLFDSRKVIILAPDVTRIYHFLHMHHTIFATVLDWIRVLPWRPEISVFTILLFDDVVL